MTKIHAKQKSYKIPSLISTIKDTCISQSDNADTVKPVIGRAILIYKHLQ